MNKYTNNSSKGPVPKVDLEYPKELWKLHNDYPLALSKIEIKEDTLSKYQLMIFDFNNIPIGNVKKVVPIISDREKYVLHSENLQLYLRLGLKRIETLGKMGKRYTS